MSEKIKSKGDGSSCGWSVGRNSKICGSESSSGRSPSHLGFLWLVILVSIDCFGVVFVVKLVFLLINVLYLCHTCISIAQGYWLSSPKPFVVNDAVLQHRLQVLQAGLFHFLSSNFKSSLRSSRRSFLGISCSSPPFRPEKEWSV